MYNCLNIAIQHTYAVYVLVLYNCIFYTICSEIILNKQKRGNFALTKEKVKELQKKQKGKKCAGSTLEIIIMCMLFHEHHK